MQQKCHMDMLLERNDFGGQPRIPGGALVTPICAIGFLGSVKRTRPIHCIVATISAIGTLKNGLLSTILR